ncbi:hypothetical protein [Cellulomonas fengjieae]|uniref:PLAT domain-containing protein n=1 Tax=Cellulomonas fengjieae TaxID=2819978 RepID=A0ABS3SKR8_9CELL|nr:hypothetical protein [Cellulomonas fengjieae]MBO3086340.1 hypothetical protein [Cellulomonas fengjieae]MBO3102256.1 hypothetical protein [Cellulomonas fengjieae]QVI65624.1 hypothetical protein KG102_16250 [Cellulomonas fengjieae]
MTRIERLWVIQTTSTAADANTDEGFALELKRETPDGGWLSMPFPDLPHDERERGRTDQYEFVLPSEENFTLGNISGSFVRIRIRGDDAWLPSSVWVIARGPDQGEFTQWKLIAHATPWPRGDWFSTDTAEGQPTRLLRVPE